ncbi:MAG: DUF4157 domain-containing protein [Polyangia bacterium]
MSSDDDKSPESLALSAQQRHELELAEHRRLEEMARDVARRYDPARMSKVDASAAGRAEKLDDATRRSMESRLGARFNDVRIIRGAFADRVTKRHRADAVTIGSTGLILLRDTPRTNMRTAEGKALLAHELTHVRQAQRGMHFAKEQGSDTAAHEQEAHRMESDVLRAEKHGHETGGPDLEAMRDKAVHRVLELLEEAQRVERDRRGIDEP